MAKLFGTDGIRGEANRYPMDGMTALKVGQAVTHLLKGTNHKPRIVVGRDTRNSGYMLERALEAGIVSMGGVPCSVGVLPTPGIAFLTKDMGVDAGIMISASHNPYQDNGIKIFSGNGFKLSDKQEEAIEHVILNNNLKDMLPSAQEIACGERIEDAFERYAAFLRNTFPSELSMKGIKVVLDTANGATYKVAPAVFRELGAEVDVINNSPNGFNINDNCGSQYTQSLEKRVREDGSAIGLAFDGDGDRLIAVDEQGRRITGDQILIICAMQLKDQEKLDNDLLVSTVMSNYGLTVACKTYGLKHRVSKVGDRYVLEQMQGLGAVIGGEESGHLIFLNHHTTGDGTLAAIQLIASIISSGKPLFQLASLMSVYPQRLMNVNVKSKPDLSTVPQLLEAIKKIEDELGDKGRVFVRYSGTQNVCRVMVEGPSDDMIETYCRHIANVVKAHLG